LDHYGPGWGILLALDTDFLNEHQHLEEAIQNIRSGRRFVLDQTMYLIERPLIRRALEAFQYNQTNTSQVLGLSEANFRYRLKKFKLPSVREVR
jgi:DNA-binding protein Fis